MDKITFFELYPIRFEEMNRITLELAYEQKELKEFEFYKPFRDLMGDEKV